MASVSLKGASIELIGSHRNTGIYRIDLSQVPLAEIRSITIRDDNQLSGGTGSASGFDLDFVKVSSNGITNPVTVYVDSFGTIPVFDFTNGQGTVFNAGAFQGFAPTDPAIWNGSALFGTVGGTYDPALATLGIADGSRLSDGGSLSLGESGQITFLLNQGVPTSGRYLYFGDSGEGNDSVEVIFSDLVEVPVFNPTVEGSSGEDTIVVGSGTNTSLGGSDNLIRGGGGNDRIFGAAGNETLFGGPGNDFIQAGAGNDAIYGGYGKDKLYGGPGNDVIFGGKGSDTLWGGLGKDTFAFDTKPSQTNVDTIKDFKVRDDSIWLDNAVFRKLGPVGTELAPKVLKKAAFWTGDKAHDASDRIIYDGKTGALSYDPDGTGGAMQVKFAQIKTNLKVTYKDFFVI